MTRNEVQLLLESSKLEHIENEIASQVNSYVNRDYLSFMVNGAVKQLKHACLNTKDIMAILSEQAELLIQFGVAFLHDEEATSDEEEYPQGEELDEDDKSETVSEHGIGIGFGITYAIYLNYLQKNTKQEFVKYLKAERIPYAAKFASELKRVYENLKKT